MNVRYEQTTDAGVHVRVEADGDAVWLHVSSCNPPETNSTAFLVLPLDEAETVGRWLVEAAVEARARLETVHLCPPKGSGVMPCCGLPPFERLADRMTLDPALVTCGKAGGDDD